MTWLTIQKSYCWPLLIWIALPQYSWKNGAEYWLYLQYWTFDKVYPWWLAWRQSEEENNDEQNMVNFFTKWSSSTVSFTIWTDIILVKKSCQSIVYLWKIWITISQSPLGLARVQIITVRISEGVLYHSSHLTLYYNSSQNEALVNLVSVRFRFELPSLLLFVAPLIAKMMWAVSCPDPTQLTQGEGVWCHKLPSATNYISAAKLKYSQMPPVVTGCCEIQ